MKKTVFISLLICASVILSCNSKKRSDEIKNYTYQEKTPTLNENLKGKLGDWVSEGTVCYGLVVIIDGKGKVVKGLPVKAKVISLKTDSIKMKALERVNLAEVKGCTKMGLAKGETWWETEGDLFKTEAEALAYLKEKGWAN